MTRALAILLVNGALLCAQQETNVNARYTVEGVEMTGTSESRISKNLREDLPPLLGAKTNPAQLADLARHISI